MVRWNKICDMVLIGSILCFLIGYPILGKWKLDEKFVLQGVTGEREESTLSLRGLFDGSYQQQMENHLHDNIYGRNLLVRIHNQVLYSIFNTSSNSNVAIGKNKQLFEPEYINYFLNINGQPTEDEIKILIGKLEELNQLLLNEDKELYIFITPAKTRYYREDIPDLYQKFDKSQDVDLAYDMFSSEIAKTSIKCFDSISFIDTHKDAYEFPLWYSTGIHWSRALGYTVAESFNQYLCENSKYDLGYIKVSLEETAECKAPDADMYNILNLLKPSGLQYYDVKFDTVEGTAQPSVFYRGGSFMGQSLNALISNRIFGENIHFENNYYFTDYYSNSQTISTFDAYEEINVCGYLKDADILILEVNEEKIHTMSWGFIDYVLENYE